MRLAGTRGSRACDASRDSSGSSLEAACLPLLLLFTQSTFRLASCEFVGPCEGPGAGLGRPAAHRRRPSLSCRFVVKRDGRTEPVHFDKITARITKLSYGLNSDFCDPVRAPEPF